jgi:hypothetical protein
MPTWVKVLLIVIVVAFVVMAIGIVFAARWVKQRGAALQSEGKVVIAEARAFGEGKDGEACVAESMTRLERAAGFIDEAKVRVFLQHCLETANVAPETCRGVPRPDEILKSARWSIDESARRGRANDQRCTRVLQELVQHCAR